MYNITKIQNGMIMNGVQYTFILGDNGYVYSRISDTQTHVYTDNGTLLVDTSCSVDGESFEYIDGLIAKLITN